MRNERFEQLKKIISKKEDGEEKITGVGDMGYDKEIQYVLGNIERGSLDAKRLEEAGYILIYPKISENPKDGEETNKYLNENYVMIVDRVSKNPSAEIIHKIAQFYNQQDVRRM